MCYGPERQSLSLEFIHFRHPLSKISALAPLGEWVDRNPRFPQRGRAG